MATREKMSKTDRMECEKNLAILQSTAATLKKMLADDDEADKATKAAGERELFSGIAEKQGTAAAILAIRSLPRRGGPGE
jgi:hypothetical protein